MPSQKPIAAGVNASFPMDSDCSIAGIRRLQMDAATITPAAKPVSIRWILSPSSFFIKKTQADPSAVPRKGMKIPAAMLMCKSLIIFHLSV